MKIENGEVSYQVMQQSTGYVPNPTRWTMLEEYDTREMAEGRLASYRECYPHGTYAVRKVTISAYFI